MYIRSDERRPRMSQGLALRVAIMGGIGVALFAVIFFRLWFLQVLSGDRYLAEANNNRTREIRVAPPRGDIVDRRGAVLVGNRTSLALQVNPQKLPSDRAERRVELARLGRLTGMSLTRVRKTLHDGIKVSGTAPVTLRQDVGHATVYYLQENRGSFPGVEIQSVYIRRYPQGTLAAHLLGSVGEVDSKELKEPRYRELKPGDEIGKGGVEYTYDRYLRGVPGLTRYQVDSMGVPTSGGRLRSTPPEPGDVLKLTIDPTVQAAGEAALAARGLPGGFVTMNVDSGQILGMGSYPTYDPTTFTHPLTQSEVNALFRDPVAAPLTDRASSGLYPTGSTFKLITAMAALSGGVITPSTTIYDGGSLTVGGESFQNAGGASYGPLTLVPALQVSSDVFFYTLGLKMWDSGQLQRWAHKLGIGRPTGLDLPEQATGLLPTQSWRNHLYKQGLTDRPWSAGDNIQLATGQGDLQTNPLQMAIAYATVANGGRVVTPHVGMEIDDPAGRVVQEIDPGPRRHVTIDPEYRSLILEGLHEAAQAPGGTSYGVFGGFPIPVAGKTGTAQRPPNPDQSWYIVLSPYPNPKLVTAVTIERGGFGADSAAPAALSILSAYYHAHNSGAAGPNGGSPG
ncbi:MAG: penicillin-binding protein 2 [Solirubrobacterales bacterium]